MPNTKIDENTPHNVNFITPATDATGVSNQEQYAVIYEYFRLKKRVKKELDKYRFGDIGLIDHEATKQDNTIVIGYLIVMCGMITFISGVCIHMTYGFPQYAAEMVFIVLFCAIFIEIIVFRPFWCFIVALVFYCKRHKRLKAVASMVDLNNKKYDD